MSGPNERVEPLVDLLMDIEPNPYGVMWRSSAETAARRILDSDWLARVIADEVDALRAQLDRLRRHKISDPGLHAMHECAKAYSLANTALREVWGYTHSTTLAFLIQQRWIGPLPAADAESEEGRAAALSDDEIVRGIIAQAQREAKVEAWDEAISIVCDCGDFDGHPGDCAATPLIHAATRAEKGPADA